MFFEAALRAGSFSAAASELYVSQAAVSKRVKQLETWLDADLFERGARSLALTEAGAQLADPVSMALDYLQGALHQVRSPTSSTVRIAANSAVAVFWLFKRLRSFALSPASCPVETIIKDDPRELLTDANDIAIIYADKVPQGWVGQMLMEEKLAPVASPEGAKRFLDDAESMSLLDYHRHAPDWINWEIWAQREKQGALHGVHKTMCQNYSHSIGRALEGKGVALASCSLLEDELASGQLVMLVDVPMRTGKGYFLVWRDQKEDQTEVSDLVSHLSES
ncbi:LysR family transcriptional regulator [Pseudophaeobacter sp.]|uniref:LysR family transcriptional regulator n=1 Tax=Pseudophaeobacter sp. TaxID=1971739 RepID=UPI00329860DB